STTTVLLSFVFNDTATTEIYTLSLHDALPIYMDFHDAFPEEVNPLFRRSNATRVADVEMPAHPLAVDRVEIFDGLLRRHDEVVPDRKSTRLNSSHVSISYAVFCLKKKKNQTTVVRSGARRSNSASEVDRLPPCISSSAAESDYYAYPRRCLGLSELRSRCDYCVVL